VSGAAACTAFSGTDPDVPSTGGTADATTDAVSEVANGLDAGVGVGADADAGPAAGVVFQEGFESTLDCPGWSLSGVTVAHEATTFRSGSGSCKVCIDSTGGDMTRTLLVTAAIPHQLEVWVRGDALTFAADVWFVAEAGNEGYLASGGKTPSASTWTKVVTSTVPPLGSTLYFRLDFNGVAKQCAYIDDVVVRTQ
jgi:hypothetical protein